MTGRMRRWLVPGSALAVVVTAAFLPGSGFGSSGAAARRAQGIPAGLAEAIHARFGAGAIRSTWAARTTDGPFFGYSIALSADGTTALVGASGVYHGKGAAYIFHVSDAGSWSASDHPAATLTNKPGPAGGQFFGVKVALSADGTTAFAAAPDAGYGAIYVFHVSAEDGWASSSLPMATLHASGGDSVGLSLAVSDDGTTLVAGAPFSHSYAGGGYVFHASSESSWASTSNPTATLSYAGESGNDGYVGNDVAISGDGTTALLSDDASPTGGGAFLYHVSAEGSWTTKSTPTAILSDANSGGYDRLGYSLALSGDGTVALLGDPGFNSGAGAVDVFHASGAAAWASTATPTATLTYAGGSANDIFGWKVSVTPDGTTALVGAPRALGTRGAAYLFHVADAGSWASSSTPGATLTSSGGHARDFLGDGSTFSADGASAIVGAEGVRFNTGAADVFHVSDASSWASSSTPTAVLTNAKLNACVVPRLKGLTVTAAKASLRARSCRLGQVSRVHAKARSGHVVSQSAKPGSRLAVGAKIAVKVAR